MTAFSRATVLGIRAAVWVLMRLLPPARHAVVHGWPDSEGNSVEVVRALRRRYGARVYWLLDDPRYSGPTFAAAELADGDRVVRVRKSSLRGVWLSVRAELVLFTHGLYTAVVPPANRLVVNLWHGDGPKRLKDTRLMRSTVVVSGSQLWSGYKSEVFAVPPSALAVVGNPRSDQLFEPISPDALQHLGLAGAGRTVVWLPTFREARGPRDRMWSDGAALTGSDDVHRFAHAMAETAQRLGLRLLVKPHPLDVDSYAELGIRTVTNADLSAAGVSLYQLLGHCDALVSDTSSVWVDYLVLDRPVGFYLPDLADLERHNGVIMEGFGELVPGPRIEPPGAAEAFLEGVARGAPELRPSAYPSGARVGVPPAPGVTDRLLDWLNAFQRDRGRRELFR